MNTDELKRDILRFVNETPEVLSTLYDAGMLPEQCIGYKEETAFWVIAGYIKTLHELRR